MRIQNATHPLIAALVGYVAVHGNDVAGLCYGLALFVVIHSLVTIWNDIEDKYVDSLNKRSIVATLQSQGRRHDITALIMILVALGAILCFFVPFSVFLWCLVFGCVGWLYNARPVQASRKPIMSMIMMWLGYGVIPFALGASFGEIHGTVYMLGFGWSLSRLSLSLLKDFKDAIADAKAHKRTFLLVYGKTLVVRLSLSFLIIGISLMIVAISTDIEWYELISVVIFASFLLKARSVLLKEQTYYGLNQVFHRCLRYQLVFDGFVLLCLTT